MTDEELREIAFEKWSNALSKEQEMEILYEYVKDDDFINALKDGWEATLDTPRLTPDRNNNEVEE